MATANINDVSMTYSSALDIAKEIDNKRLDFIGMCKTWDNLISSLEGQWQGTAQFEFATAYSKLKPKLNTIIDVLQQYSDEIRAVVAAEEEQDKESSRGFESVDYGDRLRGNRSDTGEGSENYCTETEDRAAQNKENELSYQQKIQLVNSAVPIGEPQYSNWCTGCSRATLIQRKQALEGRTPQFSKEREDRQNPTSIWEYEYTDEAGYSYQFKSEKAVLSQENMIALLEEHPEGVMIYSESSPEHAIVITHYEISDEKVQFYAYDPVNSAGDMGPEKQGIVKLEETWHYSEGGNLDNYQRYSYIAN